ncbi:MAG: TIR domain-containing protein, partial [Ktedonobacteraceae bacterium]
MKYTNAKVVLLGDSGVGKSGLGFVLAGQPFAPTESTHGRHIWSFDSLVEDKEGRKEICETLLWDMPGQPGYRLINRLYLNEVAVALVLFDASSETDPFEGVRYWDRVLRVAQRVQGGAAPPMKRFLVAARMDRGGIGVSRIRIESIVHELGFDGYFETSAKEGQHIVELAGAIRAVIDWARLPGVSSTSIFQQVKAFLVAEKDGGRVLSTVDNLYRMFLNSGRAPIETQELRTQFETSIGLVESRSLIRRFSFGNLVLLQPDLLDAYASTLINTVKEDPDELGSISEEATRAGDFPPPENERLKDKEQEKLLLIAMIEDMLRLEIALREQSDEGTYLIFPSQSTRENPILPDPIEKTVTFDFEGPLLNIYSTLTVRLAHSGLFRKREIWKNAVTYTAKTGGTCGVLLSTPEGTRGKLTLFFDKAANETTRSHFEEYIKVHLQRKALPESIKRQRIFVCPNCGFVVSDQLLELRLQHGFNWLQCPNCDTRIALSDEQELIKTSHHSVVQAMDRAADVLRDRQASSAVLQGKIETADFDVFLCHNAEDKAAVRKIGEQLKEQGILPWLDEWELAPGRPWQRLLEQQIGRIKTAAVFVGKKGLGPWQQMELDAFLREFSRRNSPVIPVLLLDAPRRPQLPPFLEGRPWVDFRKKEPDPMARLIWGITGKRATISESGIYQSLPLLESEAIWNISDIRQAIGDRSFRNYQRLADAIMKRMQVKDSHSIGSSDFKSGTLWEVLLPEIGLRPQRQKSSNAIKVVLFLRQEEDRTLYEHLTRIAQEKGAEFIILIDIMDIRSFPRITYPQVIWFRSNSLIKMITIADEELRGWLGRFITTQVDVKPFLPYRTTGPTTELFFGRDDELTRLTGVNRLGGIITGANQSGKSSLLRQIGERLQPQGFKIVRPLVFTGEKFQLFFEETLHLLGILCSTRMTPEVWALKLKKYSQEKGHPVFLLDEVDILLNLDARTGFRLGWQMRSLQDNGLCSFYLAGHTKLREEIAHEGGPYRNFAEGVILTGLTQTASTRLIQEPMKLIGFDISDKQARRIFEGTAGVAVLIQEFCIRLLSGPYLRDLGNDSE